MWLKATIFHSLECKTAERTQNNRASSSPPLLIDSHFWDIPIGKLPIFMTIVVLGLSYGQIKSSLGLLSRSQK